MREVDLSVVGGDVHGVIGPNGAGKSTLLALISGHLVPDSGSIEFAGHRIDRQPPHRIAHDGLAIVFQAARIFKGMSVLENVMVGAHCWTHSGFLAGVLKLSRARREERLIRERAIAATERVGLGGWRDRPAESLPLGQQRELQVARALCGRPLLLLLDEPASGLRASERASLAELIRSLHKEHMTVVLVEHDVGMVTAVCNRMTALDQGAVIATGTPAEVIANKQVRAVHLGERA